MSAVPPPAPHSTVNPGKTMGVVSLVLSVIGFNVIAIIVGFVGLNKSKKAGHKNGFAVAGIVIGFLSLIVIIALIAGGGALFGGLAQVCAELGEGVHEVNGVTYTCG